MILFERRRSSQAAGQDYKAADTTPSEHRQGRGQCSAKGHQHGIAITAKHNGATSQQRDATALTASSATSQTTTLPSPLPAAANPLLPAASLSPKPHNATRFDITTIIKPDAPQSQTSKPTSSRTMRQQRMSPEEPQAEDHTHHKQAQRHPRGTHKMPRGAYKRPHALRGSHRCLTCLIKIHRIKFTFSTFFSSFLSLAHEIYKLSLPSISPVMIDVQFPHLGRDQLI